MNMQIGKSVNRYIGKSAQVWILALLVIITRVPFLFDGYGHEEDSWGLVVNAWEMHDSHEYRASRFPGHPLQEMIYAPLWNQPAWIWNSFSCFFSVIATVAFYRALKRSGFNYAFEASLMLAFTPAFFIAGTYTIDYAWSLAFVMLSFAALTNKRFLWCGLFLGLAYGCRITSAMFILPWIILIWNRLDVKQWFIDALKIGITTGVVGFLLFVPAIVQYGPAFFDYSDQFPYPPFTKIAYKATIGVFGVLGIVALLFAKAKWLTAKNKSAINPPTITSPQRMTFICILIVVLQIIAYLRLPQKSGYLVPLVPFIIMLIIMYAERKTIRVVTVLFVLSSFLFSINLTDSLRGSGSSPLAIEFNVSGQEIFLDPLSGPIFSEQSKRRNKMAYVEKVCQRIDTTTQPELLICGWWYNEIKTYYLDGRPDQRFNPNTKLVFYATCASLDSAQSKYKIYYLPEQILYNDQMFNQHCTDTLAQPYPVK